ncbi:hypothetical protein ACFQ8Q_00355 [Streptomyces cyaneofuscatus]|uniref:hypothetical protein n=1 Tax=Streptomyces cyaneofuscatus TaxID=66883 RepID=UPI0036995355
MSHDLTATALVCLRTLDNSPGTTTVGSRASRELMVSVASSSARAGTDLAHVLLANPSAGAPHPSNPADEPSVRTTILAEAIAKMTGYLADAVHHLDLSATGCHSIAAAVREAATTAQRAAGPELTGTQYETLETLSRETCRLYEIRPDLIRVYTDDGALVPMAPYRALAERGLVDRDTSRSLSRGQKISVTEEGRQALAMPHPPPRAVPPAPEPPAVRGTALVTPFEPRAAPRSSCGPRLAPETASPT